MLLGYHIIFNTYGFWLPNDPRGSWSNFTAAWDLYRAGGKSTKLISRKSFAHLEHDRDLRQSTRSSLKHPPVSFTGLQARAVARGFAEAIRQGRYLVYACAILPQHVHLVVANHEREPSQIVSHLRSTATRRLKHEKLHPFGDHEGSHSPWGEGFWKVYLPSEDDLRHAIEYVQENPIKEGKPPQNWHFLTSLETAFSRPACGARPLLPDPQTTRPASGAAKLESV